MKSLFKNTFFEYHKRDIRDIFLEIWMWSHGDSIGRQRRALYRCRSMGHIKKWNNKTRTTIRAQWETQTRNMKLGNTFKKVNLGKM